MQQVIVVNWMNVPFGLANEQTFWQKINIMKKDAMIWHEIENCEKGHLPLILIYI